ncbi:hypothetical protein D3C85_1347530 [compost metagenome]
MALAAPGGGQQHRHTLEGLVIHQVEEVLEQAGVGGPVHRAAGDDQVGLLHRTQMRQQLCRSAVALQRTGQRTTQFGDAHPVQVDLQALLQALHQYLQQGMGARQIAQAARHHDHLDCLTHPDLSPNGAALLCRGSEQQPCQNKNPFKIK